MIWKCTQQHKQRKMRKVEKSHLSVPEVHSDIVLLPGNYEWYSLGYFMLQRGSLQNKGFVLPGNVLMYNVLPVLVLRSFLSKRKQRQRMVGEAEVRRCKMICWKSYCRLVSKKEQEHKSYKFLPSALDSGTCFLFSVWMVLCFNTIPYTFL